MKLMTLCYIRQAGKTLMLRVTKDSIHKGFWNGLGGKFEDGETPEECVIREVEEESGLSIRNPQLKGRITFTDKREGSGNNGHVYLFTVTEFTGELIDSPEGHLEWIDDDKLLDLKVHAGDKIFLKWLDQEKFFSAKLMYNGEELLDHQVVFY